MSSFGEVLKQCIEEQGISVNGFAKDTGINRGWLYNIFAGIKKLPEDKFHAILRDVTFTTANEDLLRGAYYREVFGHSEYENIMCIIDFFNKSFAESCTVIPEKAGIFSRPAASVSPVDTNNLIPTLRSVIREEIETSANPVIYTNYPYELNSVDNCFYAALRASAKPLTLSHLVRFERKNHTQNNLRIVLQSLRYIQLRQNVRYFYADSVSADIGGVLYPYFVITATASLLFNVSGSHGIFIHNEPVVLAQLCSQAEALIAKCTPLAAFPENILDEKDLVEPAAYSGVTGYMVRYPCWVQFADSELLGKAINPVLPFRESIIQIAQKYYAEIMRSNPLLFFTLSGVAEFAKNGRFYEAPEIMAPPFPPALRVCVLERLIESMKKPDDNSFLLDERKISVPDSFIITYFEDCVTIFLKAIQDSDAYLGQCVVTLDDKSIAADFRNFQDYIVRNGFVHLKEYAMSSLSDLLILCKEIAAKESSN